MWLTITIDVQTSTKVGSVALDLNAFSFPDLRFDLAPKDIHLAFRCAWSRVRRLCKRFLVSRNEILHPLWQFRLIKVSSRREVGENQLDT